MAAFTGRLRKVRGRALRAVWNQAEKGYRRFHLWREFRQMDRSPHQRAVAGRLPAGVAGKLRKHGFLPNKYQDYGLRDVDDWTVFLNDRQMLRSANINGQYAAILEDKLAFYLTLDPLARVPRLYLVVQGGEAVWYPAAGPDAVDPMDRLLDIVRRDGTLIVKPILGQAGAGVCTLDVRGDQALCDGKPISRAELNALIFQGDGLMVVECVRQSSFGESVYPHSLNTVRVVTMIDPDTGRPFIAGARHRFGTDKSAPTDNVSRGGVSCSIDLETGRLSHAVRPVDHGNLEFLEEHPDSGVVFSDQVIPCWTQACGALLETAARLPFFPYVGWDAALTDQGVCLIEGNHWSEVHSFQLNRPWLAEPRIKRFFQHHGVV